MKLAPPQIICGERRSVARRKYQRFTCDAVAAHAVSLQGLNNCTGKRNFSPTSACFWSAKRSLVASLLDTQRSSRKVDPPPTQRQNLSNTQAGHNGQQHNSAYGVFVVGVIKFYLSVRNSSIII